MRTKIIHAGCVLFFSIYLAQFFACASTLDEDFAKNKHYRQGKTTKGLEFHILQYQTRDNRASFSLILDVGKVNETEETRDMATRTAELVLSILQKQLSDALEQDFVLRGRVGWEQTSFTCFMEAGQRDEIKKVLSILISTFDTSFLGNKIIPSVAQKGGRLSSTKYNDIIPALTYRSSFASIEKTKDNYPVLQTLGIRNFHQNWYGAKLARVLIIDSTPIVTLNSISKRILVSAQHKSTTSESREYRIPMHKKTLYTKHAEDAVYIIRKEQISILIPRRELYRREILTWLAQNIFQQKEDSEISLQIERRALSMSTYLNAITIPYNDSYSTDRIWQRDFYAAVQNISNAEWNQALRKLQSTIVSFDSNIDIEDIHKRMMHNLEFHLPILSPLEYQKLFLQILGGVQKKELQDWLLLFLQSENRVIAQPESSPKNIETTK